MHKDLKAVVKSLNLLSVTHWQAHDQIGKKNMLASHLLVIIINNAASKSGLLDLCPFFLFFRASGLFINNSYVAYLHFHIVEA